MNFCFAFNFWLVGWRFSSLVFLGIWFWGDLWWFCGSKLGDCDVWVAIGGKFVKFGISVTFPCLDEFCGFGQSSVCS